MRKSVITAMLAGAAVLALTACTPYDVPSDKPSTPDLPTGVAPVHSTTSSTKPTGSATTQGSASGHNDGDVNFAQHLYSQHTYAVQLATLVAQQGGSVKVADLAKRVLDADQPEVKQLTSWLGQWGSNVPATAGPAAGSTGAQRLDALKQVKGADFDKQWLAAVIEHHRGELILANTELSSGVSPDAKALATRLLSTEQSEIDEMTQQQSHG